MKKRKIIITTIISISFVFLMVGCGKARSYQTEINVSDNIEEYEDVETVEENIGEDISSPENSNQNEANISDEPFDTNAIEDNCEALIDSIRFWEYACLYWYYSDINEKTIDFTSDEMESARLASLITEPEGGFTEEDCEGGLCVMYRDEVLKSANKLFNAEVNLGMLPEDDRFVVRFPLGDEVEACRILSLSEDECEYKVLNQKVEENGDGYDIIQHLYCGYWGGFDDVHGNYDVRFHLKKDEEAFYGVVLSRMSFSKVDATKINQDEAGIYTPFYGVWCCGVKDENAANSVAEEIKSKGYDAYVLISSDWSNLNSDKWYVVTAGTYASEEEAKIALSAVKAAGYDGAYVKYSGEYRGQ